MNNSKLIHDYLDGGLKQPEQDMLFAELANNSELRNEFNQHMKLHMITQNDMAMISPPAATTNAVFAQLGFSIPPSSGAAVVSSGGGIAASLIVFLKKYAGNTFTALLSAVLTALIIYYLFDFNTGNSSSNMADAQQNKALPTVVASGASPVTVIPSQNTSSLTEDDVNRIINNAMSRYITGVNNTFKNYYAAMMEQNNNIDNNSNNSNPESKVIYVPYNNFLALTPYDSKQENPLLMTNTINTNPQLLNAEMQIPRTESSTDFNIYFRGYSSKSNVAVDVSSQSNPWFLNMGIGAGYNLSKNHTIGVELGQEAFPQIFKSESWGEELTYYQNPVLLWYGATYKYSLTNVFVPDIFYPYAQVMGGFTKVGPVGRAQIGLSYRPDKRVTFNLGVEGSALWYNVQNKIYDTKKIGITYGVSINY